MQYLARRVLVGLNEMTLPLLIVGQFPLFTSLSNPLPPHPTTNGVYISLNARRVVCVKLTQFLVMQTVILVHL